MVINGIYKHKRSTTAGKVPLATDLEVGEIAINTTDVVLYTKNTAGAVIALNQSYTKAEQDQRYLPQGILPVTRIGSLDTNALPIAAGSGFSIVVSAPIPVLLGGRFMNLPAGTYPISNVDNGATTNLANKTINLYVTLSNSQAVFSYYTSAQAEAYALVFIGRITTNATTVSGLTVSKVSRLDLYRVSLLSAGTAIPVTSGNPTTTGTFDPSWSI